MSSKKTKIHMKNSIIIPAKSSLPITIYFVSGCMTALSYYIQDLSNSSIWPIISLILFIWVLLFGIFIGWTIVVQKRILFLPFVAWRIRNRENKRGVEAAKKLYAQYANRKNQLAIAFLFSLPGLGFALLMLLLIIKTLLR